MLVVIDTNVLVSALWSRNSSPAKILGMIISGELVPCYDHRIMNEYREVLERPKFNFSKQEIDFLLDWIADNGYSVISDPINTEFVDKSDKKFYEAAVFCGAKLITGNIKHFPEDDTIMTVSGFLTQYCK